MRTVSIITVIGVILTIGLFICLWQFNKRNIQEFKSELKGQFKAQLDLSHQYQGPFNIETKRLDSIRVEIEASEIRKVNDQIKYLTDVVQQQHMYTQEVIDNDLNRLNLYMAVGIGFLAILGVFIPIVSNLVTTNKLESAVKQLESDIIPLEKDLKDAKETSKTATDNANKAKEAADKAKTKAGEVDGLKEKVDSIEELVPTVSAMTIQYAVARFINMSPYALDAIVRDKERGYLVDLITAIKVGFEECRNKKIHANHKDVKSAAHDFEMSLRNGKHVTSSLHGRSSYADFEGLQKHLIAFQNGSDEDSDAHYEQIINSLQRILSDLKSK